MDKFWMVVGANTEWTKTRHKTLELAKNEAERLCRKEQQAFIVLEAVEYVSVPAKPLEWRKI